MSYTKAQICNLSLRLLHVQPITTAQLTADAPEQAAMINDVYEIIRDEVLIEHPWNFAIKRAPLTQLGGTITTWTASGTSNVWQATLTTEPANVEFDGVEGTEQTSVAACTAAYYWYWASSVLYVYSTSDPDTAYSKIDAVIPEFEWDRAFSLPADYLRLIKVEDDAKFVIEGSRLLTGESSVKIQYIAQITDESSFSMAFISALSARLAAELAMPLTEDADTAKVMFELYKEKLRKAKGIDAQEGTGQQEEDLSWEEARA